MRRSSIATLTLGALLHGIDWVIAGGESGPEHRPCDPDWLREIRNICTATGTAFFLKQLGGWPNKRGGEQAVLDGERWTQMPRLMRRDSDQASTGRASS